MLLRGAFSNYFRPTNVLDINTSSYKNGNFIKKYIYMCKPSTLTYALVEKP